MNRTEQMCDWDYGKEKLRETKVTKNQINWVSSYSGEFFFDFGYQAVAFAIVCKRRCNRRKVVLSSNSILAALKTNLASLVFLFSLTLCTITIASIAHDIE